MFLFGFLVITAALVAAFLLRASRSRPLTRARPIASGTLSGIGSEPTGFDVAGFNSVGAVTRIPKNPSHHSTASEIVWVGKGQEFSIHGFTIRDPRTYAGSRRGDHGQAAVDPSQLDVTLSVAPCTDAPPLSYWPWYSELTPEQRYCYLRWLATDRTALPPNDGYLFLYYYGLERRVLVDDADKALVFTEVHRLRRLHAEQSPRGPRGSFQQYSTSFLWFMIAKYGKSIGIEAIKAIADSTTIWTEESLVSAMAWFAHRAEPVPAWMAQIIAGQSPTAKRGVVLERAGAEFSVLFSKRYHERHGAGLIIPATKRARVITYRPASAALSVVRTDVLISSSFEGRFRSAIQLWNECVDELRQFSSSMRRAEPGAVTPEAWSALPTELKEQIDHPLANTILELVNRHADDGGQVLIKAGELASCAGLAPRPKLTRAQGRDLASIVEDAGFAIEPDPRLAGRNPEWEDWVAVFPQAYAGAPDPSRYGGAAGLLMLGCKIAEADGAIDDQELTKIMEHIEAAFQLNDHERRRLEALRSVLLKSGSDIAGIGKRLQGHMTPEARRSVGRLLVAVAGIDGVVSRAELTSLRSCFRALGLAPEVLESAIAEVMPSASDGTVVVQSRGTRMPGEAIPTPPRDQPIQLDRMLVQRIMQETREVSVLLAQAMSSDDESDQPVSEASPKSPIPITVSPQVSPVLATPPISVHPSPTSPHTSIGGRFQGFYAALITQPRWSMADAERLAREHNHMLSGALEAINEWAADRLGVPLVNQEDDAVVIDQSLLQEIQR